MPEPPQVRYAIVYRKRDRPILRMYPDVIDWEGAQFMNICLKKIIAQLDRCRLDGGELDITQLHKMYGLTLRPQSQLLPVISDMETFGSREVGRKRCNNSPYFKLWQITAYLEAADERWFLGKTMRFEDCHGEQGGAKNMCRAWALIGCDMLQIGDKNHHGETSTERGSARGFCLGRSDE